MYNRACSILISRGFSNNSYATKYKCKFNLYCLPASWTLRFVLLILIIELKSESFHFQLFPTNAWPTVVLYLPYFFLSSEAMLLNNKSAKDFSTNRIMLILNCYENVLSQAILWLFRFFLLLLWFSNFRIFFQ